MKPAAVLTSSPAASYKVCLELVKCKKPFKDGDVENVCYQAGSSIWEWKK